MTATTPATKAADRFSRAIRFARVRLYRSISIDELPPYLLDDIGVTLFDAHAALDREKARRLR